MAIRWVNAMDIQRIHNEANPDNKIGYNKAKEIKHKCREFYERDFGKVELFNKNLIPLDWYEHYFGSGVSTKKKCKKDTSAPEKQRSV